MGQRERVLQAIWLQILDVQLKIYYGEPLYAELHRLHVLYEKKLDEHLERWLG